MNTSLFDDEPASTLGTPLAERMRPRTLDEYVGQGHLVGPGQALRRAIDAGVLHSLILWGPPGTGKTTLARVLAHASGAEFAAFSAVTSGIKEIKEVIAIAEHTRQQRGRRTIFLSMKSTASTSRSRTRFCRTSSRARSCSSERPPKTRRSR